jgi:hypothetical protein
MSEVHVIAGLCFQKVSTPGVDDPHSWKRFGKLMYNAQDHRASLLLHGFHAGQFLARPYDHVTSPPYLSGDIYVWTGDYDERSGAPKKRYMTIGFINTATGDGDGSDLAYTGVLYIDPSPCLLVRMIRDQFELMADGKDPGKQTGLYCNVWLDDHHRSHEGPQQLDRQNSIENESQDPGMCPEEEEAKRRDSKTSYLTEEDKGELPF